MKCSQNAIAKYQVKVTSMGKLVAKTQFGGFSLAIDSVVFALVKDGIIYLRGSTEMTEYLSKRELSPFVFIKRGVSISLNYYQVDNRLWEDDSTLLYLSRAAFNEASNCQFYKKSHRRIKDLPNLGIKLETLLREAGIQTEKQLREMGARESWLLIHQRNHHLGIQTLFSLEGAILGVHHAVLPKVIKHDLIQWHADYLKSCQQSSYQKLIERRAVL